MYIYIYIYIYIYQCEESLKETVRFSLTDNNILKELFQIF